MKKSLLYLICLLVFGACQSGRQVYLFTSFHEPAQEGLRLLYSQDGYRWHDLDHVFLKPEAGPSKLMRDPSMVQGPDGTYHLVWTTGWRGDQGFGYASSKDLIHWSPQQFIPVMQHEPSTVNVWAPELFYDAADKRFVIIWASTIPGRFPRGIEDENNNHRMYYTTTQDFKTFSRAQLFLDPGFSVIDAVIVRQQPGKYALVLKDNTRPNRNLKMAYGPSALGPFTGVTAPFTGNFIEGPTVVKIKKDWLIYFDVYEKKIYGAMKTRDFRNFTDITNQVQVPAGHKHGTIVKASRQTLKKLQQEAAAKWP